MSEVQRTKPRQNDSIGKLVNSIIIWFDQIVFDIKETFITFLYKTCIFCIFLVKYKFLSEIVNQFKIQIKEGK